MGTPPSATVVGTAPSPAKRELRSACSEQSDRMAVREGLVGARRVTSGPAGSLSHPESYAIGFHDPEFTFRRSVGQDQGGPPYESEDGVFVMPLQPKNNNPGVLCRRVCPNVGEVQVQGDQDAAFGSRPDRNHRILGSRQAFIGNRIGLESSTAQDPGALTRKILINFQLQTVCSRGRSAVPSRASSAA
ncbi:hypothetical protein SBA4_2830006 [Candidatus Sulfopaludibacter sp. SbA4]|nr:hypothetical protein SBA4_2830006 [Candidatus Sulfopaludibacter sp. SbA4]